MRAMLFENESWNKMREYGLSPCVGYHNSKWLYTTWKVDSATPTYWFAMARY